MVQRLGTSFPLAQKQHRVLIGPCHSTFILTMICELGVILLMITVFGWTHTSLLCPQQKQVLNFTVSPLTSGDVCDFVKRTKPHHLFCSRKQTGKQISAACSWFLPAPFVDLFASADGRPVADLCCSPRTAGKLILLDVLCPWDGCWLQMSSTRASPTGWSAVPYQLSRVSVEIRLKWFTGP